MFEIKKQMNFSAAHHLLNYEGECENQHGHNWLVEAYVKGNTLDKSNILVDYKVLKKAISPSSEILAQFIYNKLKEQFPQMSKVSIWETPTSCATYYED